MVVGHSVGVHPSCDLLCFGVRGCVDDPEITTLSMPMQPGAELFGELDRNAWLGKHLSRRVKATKMRGLKYKGGECESSVCLGVSAYRVCDGFSYVGTLVFEMC